MIRSMTAFGRAKKEGEKRDVTVEIRSVNSRYLDLSIRLPRDLAFLEDRIRAEVTKSGVSRGKVEVSVTVDTHGAAATAVKLDAALTEGYLCALYALRDTYGLRDDISVSSVAQNRDLFVYERENEDPEALFQDEILPVLRDALRAFLSVREAEGERTAGDLREKVGNIEKALLEVESRSVEDKKTYFERLSARLRQTLGENGIAADEQRILTECAIFADKVAVDEEIARLRSHFAAFDTILNAGEPAGRKLDFLMQEMNRETNTIGSKCCDSAIARLVVDIKCELEKIREQIQNIE